MEKTRVEWKVGIFVTIGLVVLGMLVLNFSKGASIFKKSYELKLRTGNVGGIKSQASVLMAGVVIGHVVSTELEPDGKSVIARLKIYERYQIYRDAVFVIEQAGFLGDQYVSVIPRENKGETFKGGEEVTCQEPFNLQEVARSAAGLITRVDQTAKKLNEAVSRIDRVLLGEENLALLSRTVTNLSMLSERAIGAMDGLDRVVQTNAPVIASAVSNLHTFTEQLDRVAADLRTIVAENRPTISNAVKNVEVATGSARQIMDDVQGGKGMVGGLLKNPQTKAEMDSVMKNLESLSGSLAVASKNLRENGLWRFLWKPKSAPTNEPPAASSLGKSR